jgi:hypothetical protein
MEEGLSDRINSAIIEFQVRFQWRRDPPAASLAPSGRDFQMSLHWRIILHPLHQQNQERPGEPSVEEGLSSYVTSAIRDFQVSIQWKGGISTSVTGAVRDFQVSQHETLHYNYPPPKIKIESSMYIFLCTPLQPSRNPFAVWLGIGHLAPPSP